MNTSPPSDAERFWFAHLAAIEQSGSSVAEYAREHALSAQSLYGWRRRLNHRPSAPSFAEVIVTPAQSGSAPTSAPESVATLTVRLGTARLEFSTLPPSAWLAELLTSEDGRR